MNDNKSAGERLIVAALQAQHVVWGVVPTSKELRDAGYTDAAMDYPLTEAEFVAKCRWNGLNGTELAPNAWRYAPNQWCKDYWATRVANKGE